ncbi:MAG: glycosyltransferase family 4 protein [Cytophagales bacterium]|nr:glycosyltransferase family 4 protein [Cytophagales bacterium]
MKIVFLVPYPTRQAPSQRFRFEQYLHFFNHQRIRYDIAPFLDEATWKILYQRGKFKSKLWGIIKSLIKRKFLVLFGLFEYDYVFIHREAAPVGPPVFEWWIAKVLKKKIIYDFDDAIWLPNTSQTNRLAARLKWHNKVGSICKWSYKISAGNDYLFDYAGQFNKNVVLNPTTIDTENLHNPVLYPQPKKLGKPVIGWTGTHSTLPYLKMLVPILQKLEKQFYFTFLIISNQPPDLPLKSIEFLPWNKETEIEDLLKIDIGVMPLSEDQWSKGKCGFKALQYLSLNIPALVSPVGVNSKIVRHGENGFLCATEAEWNENLKKLLVDIDLRQRLGRKGRKDIILNYSVLANRDNFMHLYD